MEIVSAERDELKRLVEEIPDDQVPQVLEDVRRHLRVVAPRVWPPAWFGSADDDDIALGAKSEEMLGDDFGR